MDPSLTERHITHLVNSEPARPLPAAKYLLTLARKAQRGDYVSQEGKSAYQLFVDFLELAENYAEDVGLEADEMKAKHADLEKADKEQKEREEQAKSGGQDGALMRFEGAPVPIEQYNAEKAIAKAQSASKPTEAYDPDTDAANTDRLDIEKIVLQDGLAHYKDQAGRLWSGLATFWIKRGDFDQASETFEKGLDTVVTIRDFTQIFDAYAEFSETIISTLMTAVSDPESEEDEESLTEMEEELDTRMKNFEELMDRRPFLMNEVLLRRNPNEVVEWEKRVALFGDDDEKVSARFVRELELGADSRTYHRSSRLTPRLSRSSTPGKLSGHCTRSTSISPSSTKRVDRRTQKQESREMNPISNKLGRSSRRLSEYHSNLWMSLLKSGANLLSWNFEQSQCLCPSFIN